MSGHCHNHTSYSETFCDSFLCRSSKFPLLPRQPPPVPSSDDKSGVGGPGGKKKDKGAVEESSTQPPLEDMTGLELDQQLIVHTYNTALTTVHSAVSWQSNQHQASLLHSLYF